MNQESHGGTQHIFFRFYNSVQGNTSKVNALRGMTWEEFVESEYNTIGIYTSPNRTDVLISGISATTRALQYNDLAVKKTDTIISGALYTSEPIVNTMPIQPGGDEMS